MINQSHWLILIEWDGLKPPTRYYNRLHSLAIFVSGDKKQSPIERRLHSQGSAVVAQEGSVLCSSESLARTIALLAQECGAKYVAVGQVDLHTKIGEKLKVSEQDRQALARIESILGKRGRPPAEEDAQMFAVTCLEEIRGYDHHTQVILACPGCGGMLFKCRPGKIATYVYRDGENVLDWWRKSRFINGHFEYAYAKNTNGKGTKHLPNDTPIIGNEVEKNVADVLAKSDLYWLDLVKSVPSLFQSVVSILDGIFISRAYVSPETRQRDRVATITHIIIKYRTVDASRFQLAERDDRYDILDASSRVGWPSLANIILRTRGEQQCPFT